MLRSVLLYGGFAGAILLAMYPIAIQPYMQPEKWREYHVNVFSDTKQLNLHF